MVFAKELFGINSAADGCNGDEKDGTSGTKDIEVLPPVKVETPEVIRFVVMVPKYEGVDF